jgi:hypothetical protein
MRQPPVVIPNQDDFVSPTKLFLRDYKDGPLLHNYFSFGIFFDILGFKVDKKGKEKLPPNRFIF